MGSWMWAACLSLLFCVATCSVNALITDTPDWVELTPNASIAGDDSDEWCPCETCYFSLEAKDWWRIPLAVLLVLMSGMFSGLTLGLLGLSKLSLQVIAASGPSPAKEHAASLIPIRRRGNLLLCTLLLGNVMVNALLTIVTTELTNGLLGFIISSGFIVVFGEIIPQAVCSRHALAIGSRARYPVWFFIITLYPIAFPLSLVLDKMLGREVGELYNNDEMEELIAIHLRARMGDVEADRHMRDDPQVRMWRGGLSFASRKAVTDEETVLDEETQVQIWQSGHSRIPVFQGDADNIVGILMAKDLILVPWDEHVTVRTVVGFYPHPLHTVRPSDPLSDLFSFFKSGQTHMAIVQEQFADASGDAFMRTLGVVTIEDVLEKLLMQEIEDEADARRDLLGVTSTQRLTPRQADACATFLRNCVGPFKEKEEDDLRLAVQRADILDLMEPSNPARPRDNEFLYRHGRQSKVFTLVLTGKLQIVSGEDMFRCEVGPWSYIGVKVLEEGFMTADFSCHPLVPTRVLQISCLLYISVFGVPPNTEPTDPFLRSFLITRSSECLPGSSVKQVRSQNELAEGEGKTREGRRPRALSLEGAQDHSGLSVPETHALGLASPERPDPLSLGPSAKPRSREEDRGTRATESSTGVLGQVTSPQTRRPAAGHPPSKRSVPTTDPPSPPLVPHSSASSAQGAISRPDSGMGAVRFSSTQPRSPLRGRSPTDGSEFGPVTVPHPTAPTAPPPGLAATLTPPPPSSTPPPPER